MGGEGRGREGKGGEGGDINLLERTPTTSAAAPCSGV